MTGLDRFFEFGWQPNASRWRKEPVSDQGGYDLAVVEFDDQGWFHDPAQPAALVSYLAAHGKEDFLIVVFVHGWKHNAAPGDANVQSFGSVLRDATVVEAHREKPRRVLGVYLAWRGSSLSGNPIWANLSFWTRKNAAFRVAVGSVREILARLRRFQRSRNESRSDGSSEVGDTRLILVGHSFGGLILYSAVSEYLIESVTRPHVVRPFGDLVLLVNPAFEATRYQPLVTAALARGGFEPGQRVCFLAITAVNDDATGRAFPLGRWLSTRAEAVRDISQAGLPAFAQRAANLKTVGHLPWLTTHRLSAPDVPKRDAKAPYAGAADIDVEAEDEDFRKFNAQCRIGGKLVSGWSRRYSSGAVLQHVGGDAGNPFWIVEAAKEVVDGHNGIFLPVFLGFLRQLADDRLRRQVAGAPGSPIA